MHTVSKHEKRKGLFLGVFFSKKLVLYLFFQFRPRLLNQILIQGFSFILVFDISIIFQKDEIVIMKKLKFKGHESEKESN